MKKISNTLVLINLLTFFLLSAMLGACGSKKFQREIETPEIKINLVGNKATSMDPYLVGLVVTNKKSNKNVSLNLEVYANELDEKNPTFIKKGDQKYSITFEQTDHTNRELILSTTNDEVIVEEVL
jgi:hypothetical protein